MKRYEVDKRVGCIAIVDTLHEEYANRGQGLHSDDEFIVLFVNGQQSANNDWYIPDEVIDNMNKLCENLNKAEEMK